MDIRTIVTRFDVETPERYRAKAVSGVQVTYKAGWGAVEVHIWSQGGGAGSLAVSLQSAGEIVRRLLGPDIDHCTVTQTET